MERKHPPELPLEIISTGRGRVWLERREMSLKGSTRSGKREGRIK